MAGSGIPVKILILLLLLFVCDNKLLDDGNNDSKTVVYLNCLSRTPCDSTFEISVYKLYTTLYYKESSYQERALFRVD